MKGVKRGRREKEGRRVASLFAGLLLTGLAFLAPARSDQNGLTSSRGAESCRPCHLDIVESFERTAHFNASRPARGDTILGTFAEGQNVLRTHVNGVYFRMERREDGYYQTGYTRGAHGALRSRDRVGAPRPELSLLEGPPSFSASRFLPGGDRRMGQQPGLARRQGALQPPGPAPLPPMPHELLPVRGELSGRALRPRLRSSPTFAIVSG